MLSRHPLVALAVVHFLCATSLATTYRVGPGEKYAKVSEVSDRLRAGDIVEITGDISDTFTLTASGTADKPIVIRGTTRVEDGHTIRPHIRPLPPNAPFTLNISGNWYVMEGLGFTGFMGQELGMGAILHRGSNLVLRNCELHHNIRALAADPKTAGNVLVEFCEFDSNGYGIWGPITLYSTVPGAKAVVQHCSFRSNVGNHLLRVGYALNTIRYNWFEDQCHFAVQVSTSSLFGDGQDPAIADSLLPTHTDIVGNVFVSGWGSNTYGSLQIGGSSAESPGPEGDFNIAHNLFVGRRGGDVPFIAIAAHGNVDRINVYSNAFVDGRYGGLKVYERGEKWQVSRTLTFKTKMGREDPIVDGSNNWISQSAQGIPDDFINTVKGVNPGFFDFVDYDFRPVPASALARTGIWPLPNGRTGSLVPEYEPQRGIPADLKPRLRRKAEPPSAGPFEACEVEPGFKDDSADLVLGVRDVSTDVQWELPFVRARHMALEYLSQGKPQEALQCAKMQFILSPLDERTMNLAIESVKQMLAAADGNDARARLFEEYARYGPEGKDGVPGTQDDLVVNPIEDVTLDVFRVSSEAYREFDETMDGRKAMCVEGKYYAYWWETRWFETEKILARVNGAEFEEAFARLMPLLAEAAKRTFTPDDKSASRRNQNLVDRLREGLGAVVKSRTCSMAGVREAVDNYANYALYGPAGRDGVAGTSDDIDVGSQGAPMLTAGNGGVGEELAKLKARYGDTGAIRSLNSKLGSIEDAKNKTVHKLNFIAAETAAGRSGEFLYIIPTALELYNLLRAGFDRARPVLTGFEPEDAKFADELANRATASADNEVAEAYRRLVAARPGEDVAFRARLYVTAYVGGAHDRGTYRELTGLAGGEAADGTPPLYLVEDALSFGEPFLARRLLAALDDAKETPLPEGKRTSLLGRLEDGQYDAINSISKRTGKMESPEIELECGRGLEWCADYLEYYPAGRYTPQIQYQKAHFKFRLKDYAGAREDIETFLAGNPTSPFTPKALLVRGLALSGLGQKDASIKVFEDLAATYPKEGVAAEALFFAGISYLSSREYDKATECFQRIVDFYPENQRAAEARVTIEKLRSTAGERMQE